MPFTPISSLETDIIVKKEELYTDTFGLAPSGTFRVESDNLNLPTGANSRAKIEYGNTDGKVPQWVKTSDSGCSNGAYLKSAQTNDYIAVGFYGTGISVIATKSGTAVIVACSIDGGSETSVDMYGSAAYQQVVYSLTGLTYGYHELIVRITNSKNSSSTGYFAYIDAFDIYTDSQKNIDNSNNVKREDMTVSITAVEKEYNYDFGGKVSGSTTANKNLFKYANGASLVAPASFSSEYSTANYGYASIPDNTLASQSNTTSTNYSQQLYSFDLSNLGANDIVKNYIRSIEFKWKGYSESINSLIKDFYTNHYIWNNTTSAYDSVGVVGGKNATFNRTSTRYNSLGTLVAAQRSAYEQLTTGNIMSNGTVNLASYTWEQGTISSTTGCSWLQNKVTSTSYIRTVNSTSAFPSSTYRLSFTPTVSTKTIGVAVYYLDVNGNLLSSSGWQYFSPVVLTTPSNCYYVAMLIKYTDATTITTSVVTDHSVSFIQCNEESTVNLLTANMADVETDTAGFSATDVSVTLSRDTAEYYNGSASLKVVTPGSASAEGYFISQIPVTPNNTYTYSVWLKGSGTVYIRLSERNSTTGLIGTTDSSFITLSSTWTRYSVTRTFGSNGDVARLYAVTYSTTQAITFYADCLQIEQKTYATSWTLGTRGNTYEATLNLLTTNQASVETDTTGFTAINSATITRDTGEYYNGSASLKIVTPGSVDYEGVRTSLTTVDTSMTYTASCYMKGTGNVRLSLVEFTSGDGYIGETTTNVTLSGGWVRVSATRTFGATGAKASLYIQTQATTSLTMYIDALQLEQKSSATAFVIGSRSTIWEALPYGKCMPIEEGTTNLLTENMASIETDTIGFTINAGGELLTRTLTDYYHGISCLKVVTPGSVGSEGFYTSSVTVTPNNYFTASVYVKGNGNIKLVLNERNSISGSVGSDTLDITLTSTWKKYSVTRLFGSNGDRARISLYTTGTVQATTFYADCFQLEQKAYATSWTLPSVVRTAETLTLPTTGLSVSSGAIEGIVEINNNSKVQDGGAGKRILLIPRNGSSTTGITFRHNSAASSFVFETYNNSDVATSSSAILDSTLVNGFYYYKIYWSSSSAKVEFWNLSTKTKTAEATISTPNLPTAFASYAYLGSTATSSNYTNTRFGKHRLSSSVRTTDPDFSYLMQQDSSTLGIWEFNDSMRNSVLDDLTYIRDYDLSKYVGSDNKVHFMATTRYPSDGTYVSAVNTDYVSLSVNHCYAKLTGVEEQNSRVYLPSGVTPSAATFTRSGSRIGVNGNTVATGIPDYSTSPIQSYDKAIMVEEGTTNLLTENQASVETDTTGFGINMSGTTLTRSTAEYYNGVSSLSVVCDGTISNQGFLFSSYVTVAASQTYTASVWLKGSGTVIMSLKEKTSALVTVGDTVSSVITLTPTWTRYNVTRTFGSTGERAAMMVYTNVAQTAVFYADCLQLEQKAYATAWTLPSVVRAAETLTLPTTGLNPNHGTIEGIVEVNDNCKRQTSQSPGIFEIIRSNSSSRGIGLYQYASGSEWRLQTRNDSGVSTTATLSNTSLTNGMYYYKCYWSTTTAKIEVWSLTTRTKIVEGTISTPNLPTGFGSLYVGYNVTDGHYTNTRFGKHKLSNVAITADPDFTNLMPVDENTISVYGFNSALTSSAVYYTKPKAISSSAIELGYSDTVTIDYTTISKNGTSVTTTFNAPLVLPENDTAGYQLLVDSTTTAQIEADFNYIKPSDVEITECFVAGFEVSISKSYKTLRGGITSADPKGFLLQERNATMSISQLWSNSEVFNDEDSTYHLIYTTDPTVGGISRQTIHLSGVKINDCKIRQSDNAINTYDISGVVTKIFSEE